jgi:hypothetical protein
MKSTITLLGLAVVATAAATAAAACGKGKPHDQAPSSTTPLPPPPPPPVPGTPPGTTTPAANSPHPTDHPSGTTTAVVEGAACTNDLRPVTDVPIAIDGARLSFTRDRGGGCPTRAVYTAFFIRTNPVQVRVCHDPDADHCKMMILAEQVTIDLTPALTAAGATSAVLAK